MASVPPEKDEKVNLELSKARALVLFEFLSRFSEQGRLDICDQSEERVLWDIRADLECTLLEPLSRNYEQELQSARESVRDVV